MTWDCPNANDCGDCTSHSECLWCDSLNACGNENTPTFFTNCTGLISEMYDCPDNDEWYDSWIFISMMSCLAFFLLLGTCICCLMKAGQASAKKQAQARKPPITQSSSLAEIKAPEAIPAQNLQVHPVTFVQAPAGVAPVAGFYGPPPTFVSPPPQMVAVPQMMGPQVVNPLLVNPQMMNAPMMGQGPYPQGGVMMPNQQMLNQQMPYQRAQEAPMPVEIQPQARGVRPIVDPASSPPMRTLSPSRMTDEAVVHLKQELDDERNKTKQLNDRVTWLKQAIQYQETASPTAAKNALETQGSKV